jgi:hypothetical protein
MGNGNLAVLVAASILFANGAVAADTRAFDQPPMVPAHSNRDAAVGTTRNAVAPIAQSRGRVAKRESLRGTDAFVLLGMAVVLVGVVARPRRRFRRSGTILLR